MDVQQAYAQRQRVSALGYWIGGLLMVGAIIGGIVIIASEGIAMVEEFQSAPGVSVPSEGTLTLAAEGDHTLMVIVSGRGILREDNHLSQAISEAVQVELFTADGNDQLVIQGTMEMATELNGKAGHAIGKVDVGSHRRLKVRTWFAQERLPADGQLPPSVQDVELRVTKMNFETMGMRVFQGIGIAAIVFVVGLIVVIITIVRRSQNPPAPGGEMQPSAPYGLGPQGMPVQGTAQQTDWQQQPPPPPGQQPRQ